MTIQMDDQNDFLAVHEDVVKRVKEKQPDDEYLYELADLFMCGRYRTDFGTESVCSQSSVESSQR